MTAVRADGSPLDGTREPSDSLTFMKNPDLWPLGPILPLARREPVPEVNNPYGDCGIMIAAPGAPRWTVFCGVNIVANPRLVEDLVRGSSAALIQVLAKDYDDAEAIVDDGWRVG